MPKLARYTLTWSAENDHYELCEHGNTVNYLRQREEAWWFTWLEAHSSFSFLGKRGKLTFLKEPRVRGTDHWYAYRSRNRQSARKYAGRTADLTVEHLEEIAAQSPLLETAAQQYQVPLLEPKFHPPRLHTTLIERKCLLEKLDAALKGKLMTIPCSFSLPGWLPFPGPSEAYLDHCPPSGLPFPWL